MKKPTGKLAFAYETIRNLEDKLKVAESMHVDSVRHVWESRNCGSCTELAEHHDRLKAQNTELAAHNAFLVSVLQSIGESHLEDGETEAAESVLCHKRVAPQQCLRDVKAEAVLSAAKFFAPSRDIDVEALESYAARVKAGEV